MAKYTPYMVRIAPEQLDHMRRISERADVPVARLFRQAVDLWLKRYPDDRTEPVTAWALHSDGHQSPLSSTPLTNVESDSFVPEPTPTPVATTRKPKLTEKTGGVPEVKPRFKGQK